MQTHSHNTFTTIHTEGSLLPPDLLQRVLSSDKELGGLSPADYHLAEGEKLNEAVNRSWNRLQGAWSAFQTSKDRLKEGDPGTTLTRERWLLPLFQELNYGRLATSKAIEIEGKEYPISHNWNNVPIHLVGCGVELDRRAAGVAGAAKSSPHSLLQELLNRDDERTWGLVSNGLRLRILRDNTSLTRQAYLEFDLEAMFSGEVYSDFVLLWMFCHQSRFESRDGKSEGCWLEKWSKKVQERGIRALDQLRRGVEEAISTLGSGFLAHQANQHLRKKLHDGELDAQEYYRQLLRLVYRLIFMFVAEDRDLLLDPGAEITSRDRYMRYYSTARLRRMAEKLRGGRHADLWQGLKLVTDFLGGISIPGTEKDLGKISLGLPILSGFLFSDKALPDLDVCQLDNQSLLTAIRSLSITIEGKSRRLVDYKNLGPEELGSVYESLLELHPMLNSDAGTFELTSASGHERKTTGSYYTPSSLIHVLLDSALDPVIEQAIKNAGSSGDEQQSALLNLKVCDPACGSGHFLIAAAHRIAHRLAQIRSSGDEPPPTTLRSALRQVIAHCIYAVDVNPMAVELCKVNLWLESIEPGKPLSFLDAHIQCGDSLVGVSPGLDISEIPDGAFNPAFGDDKATATALKKRNKRERGGQLGFRWKVTELTSPEDLVAWMAQQAQSVEALPEDSAEQVQSKADSYHSLFATNQYQQKKLEYDLWTAAFFWHIPKGDAEHMLAPTQQELVMLSSGGSLDAVLVDKVRQMAGRLRFFHWELAFPQVFATNNPGFDCVLGNPPWERIKLQEEEFFTVRDREIAAAPNKAARQKFIDALVQSNPALAAAFKDAKHEAECSSKFVRDSLRFPLSAVGDINTYALFAELTHRSINILGWSGIIVPTGIATDDTTKDFFSDLTAKRALVSLYGFENTDAIFPGVHRNYKFCLFTTSGSEVKRTEFSFLATQVSHLKDQRRRFYLATKEIALFNPNTHTMPIFRNKVDAELIRKIYLRVPVLIDEKSDDNPWQLRFLRMIDMTNDSYLFRSEPLPDYVPLYEAKMIQQFDHRAASVIINPNSIQRQAVPGYSSLEEYKNPHFCPQPRFWIPQNVVHDRLEGYFYEWLIGFQDLTNPATERIILATLLPRVGVGNTLPLILLSREISATLAACLLQNINSLVLDYVSRSKVGYLHLNYFIFKQFPVLPPRVYTTADIKFIAPRVLELVYTAYDLKPFAEDMGNHGEPFHWDEEHRALLRAELDAYYARLYGLTRDELRYILDPQDVYGPDFPGETFRVLKEKEIRQIGEYRTRRLVMEAWDRLEGVEPAPAYMSPAAQEPPKQPVPSIVINTPPAPIPSTRQVALPRASVETGQNQAQPSMIDFSVYRCQKCDKMVMGYERENHLQEVHKGKPVEWKKIR